MIRCLSNVFSETGFLQILDGLTVNRTGIFHIKEDSSPALLRLYIDVAARLGVELAGMALPLTGDGPEDALSIRIDGEVAAGFCEIRLAGGGVCISASCQEDLERGTAYFATCYPYDGRDKSLQDHLEERALQCLTALTVDGKTLQVQEITGTSEGGTVTFSLSCPNRNEWGISKSYEQAKHHFQQNLDVRIVADEEAATCPEAVLCTALRLALENYETISPYGVQQEQPGCRNVKFRLAERTATIENRDGNLTFSGQPQALAALAESYAAEEKDPFDSPLLSDLEAILSAKNEIGQALEAICQYDGKEAKPSALVTREYTRAMVDRKGLEHFLAEKWGEAHLLNFNDGKEVYRDHYRCSWEGRNFLSAFCDEVLPAVKPGDVVDLFGRLSEDTDVRRSLEREIERKLREKGAGIGRIEILRSFKSGYSWIEERVLPALKESGWSERVAAVEIRFPYLLNERGDDTFEDESTPNYGRHRDDPLKFFDIPTRWLQELFPVDELLQEKLSIPTAQVAFIRDDALPHTYVLTCFDEEGALIYEDDFDVKYVQKKYIKKYPQIGRTHVTCGWLSARINGRTVLDKHIASDTEKVWQILEEKIIPKLEACLLKRYGTSGLVAAQPLFNRLQINISMSEMDFDLGYRQERISTIEAMQEDLYFYLLDWFKTYGERECGSELDNVGLIMPEPEIRKGMDTEIEVILYEDLTDGAKVFSPGGDVPIVEKPVLLRSSRLTFEEGVLCQSIETDDALALHKLRILDEMVKKGIIDFYQQHPVTIRMESAGEIAEAQIPKHQKTASTLSEADRVDLLENQVVDYEQYLDLLRYYEGMEHVQIIPAETTYKGRKIFAISCICRSKGVCYGHNKLKSERISAAFTARHHGNESSSLNSTFRLLDRLLGDMAQVREKVNVILVPFINIDGGMLHCQVQRKHPKWLCHPARYNSAGFEFRKDFDNPHSIYGEARLLGKLWDEYLFDVITDNHGFEGHELCQPFSGYISPWYKSFWVPRAFYYGYVWYRGDAAHMMEIGSRIRSKVCDAINGDREIRTLNLEFADRFYKYAQRWFPDLFRLDKYEDVVFYWIDTNEKPRTANYGIRNPEITALDWTTEVADETAVGAYMGTNVRAHHISDLAVFEVLEDCPLHKDCGVRKAGEGWTFSRFRRHPLFSE
ncbi:hypothetical protein [Emergencia timonensis]|uniref:hypothetical protein n=1 Tax=Emergencia timonensis TaxID=1776384 RepID=UPI00241E0E64|nr:hypothetical protein [Emergencia timonensis]